MPICIRQFGQFMVSDAIFVSLRQPHWRLEKKNYPGLHISKHKCEIIWKRKLPFTCYHDGIYILYKDIVHSIYQSITWDKEGRMGPHVADRGSYPGPACLGQSSPEAHSPQPWGKRSDCIHKRPEWRPQRPTRSCREGQWRRMWRRIHFLEEGHQSC